MNEEDELISFRGTSLVPLTVSNLQRNISSKHLIDVFSRVGLVHDVIIYKNERKHPKFALVIYYSLKTALAAVKRFDGYFCEGLPLSVCTIENKTRDWQNKPDDLLPSSKVMVCTRKKHAREVINGFNYSVLSITGHRTSE